MTGARNLPLAHGVSHRLAFGGRAQRPSKLQPRRLAARASGPLDDFVRAVQGVGERIQYELVRTSADTDASI